MNIVYTTEILCNTNVFKYYNEKSNCMGTGYYYFFQTFPPYFKNQYFQIFSDITDFRA